MPSTHTVWTRQPGLAVARRRRRLVRRLAAALAFTLPLAAAGLFLIVVR